MANKNRTQCPVCTRDIAIVGEGTRAKLAEHNEVRRDFMGRSHVSPTKCTGSGLLFLALEISRAEHSHDVAKSRHETARVDLEKATKSLDAAREEMERSARALDELRALQSEITTKRSKGSKR